MDWIRCKNGTDFRFPFFRFTDSTVSTSVDTCLLRVFLDPSSVCCITRVLLLFSVMILVILAYFFSVLSKLEVTEVPAEGW